MNIFKYRTINQNITKIQIISILYDDIDYIDIDIRGNFLRFLVHINFHFQ